MSRLLRPTKGRVRSSEPVWLTIVWRNGQYSVWGGADDADFRSIFKIPPEDELPGICVHRLNTPARNEYQRQHLRKYRKVGQNLPQEVLDKVFMDSVAHCTLVDWRLIAVDSDEPTDYSPEAAIKFFNEDPDFFDAVVAGATDEEHHRVIQVEEDGELLGEA